MDVDFVVDPDHRRGEGAVEDVAPALAVGRGEVEVVAGDVQAVLLGGEAEADHRALGGSEVEDVLGGDHLVEGAVGLRLLRDRPRVDALEGAVDADCVDLLGVADLGVDRIAEGIERGDAGQLEPVSGIEVDQDRERRPRVARDGLEVAVGARLPEPAVQGDHLAVDPVQGPEAEVAAALQLGERDVAVIGAVQERGDGRGLEDAGGPVGGQVLLGHRLDVEGADQALVEPHLSPALVASSPSSSWAISFFVARSRQPSSTSSASSFLPIFSSRMRTNG